MRRKGLLAVTGCNDSRFNSLSAREELPFVSAGTWREYSLENAFELRLMLNLVDGAGASLDMARYIVGNSVRDLQLRDFPHPLNFPQSSGDLWVGAAIVSSNDSIEGGVRFHRIHFGGLLPDAIPTAESAKLWDGETIVGVVMANASEAAREVRKIALEIGLPEGGDHSPIWTSIPAQGANE